MGDGTLTQRIWHPYLRAYLCRPSTLCMGLLGLVCFFTFLPAWFAGAWLPHPAVGAWVAWEAWLRARRSWRRMRWLEVEVYDDHLRILDDEGVHEVRYEDVYQLYLRAGIAEFHAEDGTICLEAEWPGYREAVTQLVRRAGLAPLPHRRTLAELWQGPSCAYQRL